MKTQPAIDIIPIADQSDAVHAELLALNNANARETSLLTANAWEDMISEAFLAICTGPTQALLLVMPDQANYDSPNYQWFQSRYQQFAYVDRIVVADDQRGTGVARQLYEHLFTQASAAGFSNVFCEVNQDPPNPGSDAFHARLGFQPLATEFVAERGKTVQYLGRPLPQ